MHDEPKRTTLFVAIKIVHFLFSGFSQMAVPLFVPWPKQLQLSFLLGVTINLSNSEE
jgi:hypothetical protein